MPRPPLSDSPLSKEYKRIHGHRMAYHDTGEGHPFLFLHGNPTAAYLWRNVIPYLSTIGRCIAPDLMGMGDSDKLDNDQPERYRFVSHRRFLGAFIDSLALDQKITLVLHDWGSALGFDWANHHRDRVAGIVYMEGIVQPISFDSLDPGIGRAFQGFRSPAGESMILEKNFFIERMLPSAVSRGLNNVEMTEYRRPFIEPDHRDPMLVWPRELPIDGQPADVAQIVEAYGRWMSENTLPKLFINATPGSMLVGPQREFCRTWPNQTEVTVPGVHFIQEDSPTEIGEAIAGWWTALAHR